MKGKPICMIPTAVRNFFKKRKGIWIYSIATWDHGWRTVGSSLPKVQRNLERSSLYKAPDFQGATHVCFTDGKTFADFAASEIGLPREAIQQEAT